MNTIDKEDRELFLQAVTKMLERQRHVDKNALWAKRYAHVGMIGAWLIPATIIYSVFKTWLAS